MVSIVMPSAGGVDGEVRDAVTGRFLSGFAVVAHGPDGALAKMTKISGAAFELLGLVPGMWSIEVARNGYETRYCRWRFQRRVTPPSEESIGQQ